MPLRLFSVDKPAAASSSLAARASEIASRVTGRSASPRSQRATQASYAPSREPRMDSESGDSSDEDDEDDDAIADAAACTLAAEHAASQLASPAEVDSWVPHTHPPASRTDAWAATDGAYLGDALVGATVSVLDVQGQRAQAKVILYAGRGECTRHTHDICPYQWRAACQSASQPARHDIA